jgi:hypothetical protein
MRRHMGMRSTLLAGFSLVGILGCGGSSVATLTYVGVSPTQPRIGDVATVTFKLTDYRGVPLAGTDVSFHLDAEKRGVTLSPLSASSLKADGTASTQLVVSNGVTSVIVIAKAGDKEVRSPPISFAGSFASGRQLTFQCGPLSGVASGGVHAIGTYDQSRNLIAGVKLNCTAHVADRNGDGLPSALVSFVTEAGAIGPTETTVADVVGNATILYKTSYPLPKETDPGVFVWNPPGRNPAEHDLLHTGEYLVPLWMEPYRWTSNPIGTLAGNPPLNPANLQEPRRADPIRKKPDGTGFYQNNPRDNLVAMIAVTSGEEGFTDNDNDGKYTEGEPFDDLTEPFVDSNDNGTWDPDEKFIDTNGNAHWDGKNDKWDGNTLIWAQERILWTGIPDALDEAPPVPTVRGIQSNDGMPIRIGCHGGSAVNFAISDPWFNGLARNSDSDGCSTKPNKVVDVVGGDNGITFTYPPVTISSFFLSDVLPRDPQPMTTPPSPGCFEPNTFAFTIPVVCSFTASPVEGHVVSIVTSVSGLITRNIP